MANIGTFTAQSAGLAIVGIAGVDDNDVVMELVDAEQYDSFYFSSTTGVMEVDVSVNGTDFNSIIALTDEASVAPATKVIITVAALLYSFRGNFKAVRVRQASATAVTDAAMNCRRPAR